MGWGWGTGRGQDRARMGWGNGGWGTGHGWGGGRVGTGQVDGVSMGWGRTGHGWGGGRIGGQGMQKQQQQIMPQKQGTMQQNIQQSMQQQQPIQDNQPNGPFTQMLLDKNYQYVMENFQPVLMPMSGLNPKNLERKWKRLEKVLALKLITMLCSQNDHLL